MTRLEYFNQQAVIETDECILWPYAKIQGYGNLKVKRKSVRANRLALISREIYPLPSKPNALHTCGTPACFNYRHLYWGNQKENARDRFRDGNHTRGVKNGNAKLSPEDVLAIRASTDTNVQTGKRFGISATTVCEIQKRRRWGWL